MTDFIKATRLYLSEEKTRNEELLKQLSADDKKYAIKILRMPIFCSEKGPYSPSLNTTLLPPLALAQIVSHFRRHGVRIDQDDLNIKIHYDNHHSDMMQDAIDVSIFFDEEKVSRYCSGGADRDLDLTMERLESETNFYGYDMILLSLPVIFGNSSCLMFALSLSRFLKKKYNTTLILGGAAQSIDLLLKYDPRDIDYIIYGDGEDMLFKLLVALRNNIDLKEFPEFKPRKNGQFISNEPHPPLKPDFSGLPMDKYRYIDWGAKHDDGDCGILQEFNKSKVLLIPFKFIKGCVYSCIFCPSSANKSVYALPPTEAVSYLKELQEEYEPTGFFFLNDAINVSRQYVDELCSEIIKNKIKILWSDCARADNLDRDILFKMREAGCIRLIFGMETASPRLLKYIDKRIDLKRLENIMRWADEAGIWVGLEIICGLPHEKDEDIEETIRFLNKNREYINNLYLSQFDLRADSVLLRNAERLGIENITEINQYADEEFTYFQKYGYDETDGLRWRDKKRQIVGSYKKFSTRLYWKDCFPMYESDHFLFFLYDKFNDKKKVRDQFIGAAVKKDSLYLDPKNYAISTREFNKILLENPKHEAARLKLGNVYLQRENFSEALGHFSRVLELNLQSADAYQGMGFCYLGQGQTEKAVGLFCQALKLNPQNEHIHFGLGLCYFREKQIEKAIHEFNQTLGINPRHRQADYHLGLCLLQHRV